MEETETHSTQGLVYQYQEEPGGEIKDLLQKLSSWSKERKASQDWLENLLSLYSGRVDIREEVVDLQYQLSEITEERNQLQETVQKLREEIRVQRDKFARVQDLLSSKEDTKLEPQGVEDPCGEEQGLGRLNSDNISLENHEEYGDFDHFNHGEDTTEYEPTAVQDGANENEVAETDLSQEENIGPTENNDVKCEKCPFVSYSKLGLKKHIEKTHHNMNLFSYDSGSAFSRKSHIANEHTEEQQRQAMKGMTW